MTPTTFIYLTSNQSFHDAFIKHSRHNWTEKFLCVYDDRRISAPSSEAVSLSSLNLDDNMKGRLTPTAYENYLKYPLRFKMALPFAVRSACLMCDDDVLLQRDPEYLGYNWATYGGLNRLPWNDVVVSMTSMLSDAVGIDWDPDIHQQWACDAGIFRFDSDTKHTYLTVLNRVLGHEDFAYHYDLLSKSLQRVFDQQILSMTANIRKMTLLRSRADYSFVPYKYPSKYCRKLPDSTWVHYCATSHKQAWLDFFINELEKAKAS